MGFFRFYKRGNLRKEKRNNFRVKTYDKMDYYYEITKIKYFELNQIDMDNENLTDVEENEIVRRSCNHIGFFISWIIRNHFLGDGFDNDNPDIEAVRQKAILGVDFIIENCDGKFWSEDIAKDIRPFVDLFYENFYLNIYCDWVEEKTNSIPFGFIGSWEDYDSFEPVLDSVYESYLANGSISL